MNFNGAVAEGGSKDRRAAKASSNGDRWERSVRPLFIRLVGSTADHCHSVPDAPTRSTLIMTGISHLLPRTMSPSGAKTTARNASLVKRTRRPSLRVRAMEMPMDMRRAVKVDGRVTVVMPTTLRMIMVGETAMGEPMGTATRSRLVVVVDMVIQEGRQRRRVRAGRTMCSTTSSRRWSSKNQRGGNWDVRPG